MLNLREKCIIAAVRDNTELEAALINGPENIFLLKSNILKLPKITKLAHEKNKKIFVHIDLTDGISKDSAGIEFISKILVDGIISTRTNLIKCAREHGISTVQRFFIVDSKSIDTAYESLKSSRPDMVELLPGVIPKAIRNFSENLEIPIIAGGLIESEADVKFAFEAGASAISTGKKELWNILTK